MSLMAAGWLWINLTTWEVHELHDQATCKEYGLPMTAVKITKTVHFSMTQSGVQHSIQYEYFGLGVDLCLAIGVILFLGRFIEAARCEYSGS
jgi:hypothetical protein